MTENLDRGTPDSVDTALDMQIERMLRDDTVKHDAEDPASQKLPDSEQSPGSDKGPEPQKSASDPERDALMEKLGRYEARQEQLEARLKELTDAASAADDEIDYDPDVGDVDEPVKEGLTKVGRDLMGAIREIRNEITTLKTEYGDRVYDMQAETVRESMKVSKSEEERIVEWAREMGFGYKTPGQLRKVVETYRGVHGDPNKKETPKQEPATPQAASETPTPRTDSGKKDPDELFNERWEANSRKVLESLKSGRLPAV